MAETQFSLATRRQYTFPQIGASAFVEVPLPDLLPVVPWRSGTLLVRIYSKTMAAPASAFFVRLYAVMAGADDPRNILLGPLVAEVPLAPGTTTTPELFVQDVLALGIPMPALLRGVLRFQTGGMAGSCDLTLAIDLVLRDA